MSSSHQEPNVDFHQLLTQLEENTITLLWYENGQWNPRTWVASEDGAAVVVEKGKLVFEKYMTRGSLSHAEVTWDNIILEETTELTELWKDLNMYFT